MIWPFWVIFLNSSSKKVVFVLSFFLIEYLSTWTILSSVAPTQILSPIHLGYWLEQEHTGFLFVLLPFKFIFWHVLWSCLVWVKKTETKSLREVHASSPELRSMVGLPLPTLCVVSCLAPRTAAIREGCAPPVWTRHWHGGLLSHSEHRSDAVVPGLSRLQKGGGIFRISFPCTHMPRKYNQALFVLKMRAGEKPQRWNLTKS